jgi:Skp family chaperone for outer membrane proteins
MKTMIKALLLATAPLAAIVALPSVAAAQAAGGVGIANLNEAVEKSNAWVLAANQIKITYKAQIDAFQARSNVLTAQIQPLITAFQTAQRAPNPNNAALQAQATTIQTQQQNANKELQGLYAPIGKAEAYAQEQIATKIDAALKAAMRTKGVGIVLQPQAAISYQPAADITPEVIAELNKAVPSVGIVPPANWQPGGQDQGAAPAAPAGATPAPAAPAGTKPRPQGR